MHKKISTVVNMKKKMEIPSKPNEKLKFKTEKPKSTLTIF